jgi:hypothetical protein
MNIKRGGNNKFTMFLEHIIVIFLLVGFAIKVWFLIKLVIEISFEKVALMLGTFKSLRGRARFKLHGNAMLPILNLCHLNCMFSKFSRYFTNGALGGPLDNFRKQPSTTLGINQVLFLPMLYRWENECCIMLLL